jgi:hypothetical protein
LSIPTKADITQVEAIEGSCEDGKEILFLQEVQLECELKLQVRIPQILMILEEPYQKAQTQLGRRSNELELQVFRSM